MLAFLRGAGEGGLNKMHTSSKSALLDRPAALFELVHFVSGGGSFWDNFHMFAWPTRSPRLHVGHVYSRRGSPRGWPNQFCGAVRRLRGHIPRQKSNFCGLGACQLDSLNNVYVEGSSIFFLKNRQKEFWISNSLSKTVDPQRVDPQRQ